MSEPDVAAHTLPTPALEGSVSFLASSLAAGPVRVSLPGNEVESE